MRIRKVRIQNFLSIKDSGEIEIDNKITCLLGKNECGKTNFLKALESFSSDYEYSEEYLCSYSKTKEKLEGGKIKQGDIEMITLWFDVEKEDKEQLVKINKKLAKVRTLEITKYFNDKYTIKSPELNTEDIKPDVNDIIKKLESELNTLSKKLEKHSKRYPTFVWSKEEHKKHMGKFLSIDFYSENIPNAFKKLIDDLRNLPNRDPDIDSDIINSTNTLVEIRNKLTDKLRLNIENKILEMMPSLVYFDDIERLEDNVKIAEFISDSSRYKTLNNLVYLAGLNVEKLSDKSIHERRSATEIASTRITGLINDSWKQETVEVKLGVDGEDLIVFVEDKTEALDPPSRRSQGFQWFLSFYINFTAGSEGELKNTILLLDDPGVYLHPSGQKDLLRTLEKLSKSNQIIYSTHSPFLIDKGNLDRIKIVEKRGERVGTLIKEKFYDSDFDALEPIRAAIGATIGDSLFGFKENVIVEGWSDYLIIEGMSHYLNKSKKEFLDLSKVAIIPVGGAQKVPYFALMVWKEGYKFAIVLDNDNKGRGTAKELKEKHPIDENQIIILDEIVPEEIKGVDITTEDLIDPTFYNKAVNMAYKELFKNKGQRDMEVDELDSSIFMQTKKYSKFFRENGLGKFDKILVAKEVYNITSDTSCTDDDLKESTIKNFEELFKTINDRLSNQS